MGDYIIPMALAVLFHVVKNPDQVAQLKAALRKLRDILITLPLDDDVR
jgi:hypothetical protein